MDEKSIGQHVRPWEQMLMFFARTQREYTWKSPPYRFTRRQGEAWEVLARRAGDNREDDNEDDNEEDEVMFDNIDEGIEEMETDNENTTLTPAPSSKHCRAYRRRVWSFTLRC
jgi:hypothetical protein